MATWLQMIQTELTIQTGDGKFYQPFWMPANKRVEYCIAQFNFKGVPGTRVVKGEPKGATFDIEILFQGLDNINEAARFEKSAADPNYWRISHPYYGFIICQPLSLTFDNKDYNVTRITGTVVQTISSNTKEVSLNQPDMILAQSQIILGLSASAYAQSVPFRSISDIQALQNHINSINSDVRSRINSVQQDLNDYVNAYNTANKILNNIIYDAQEIARAVQALIYTPANFLDTIANRLAMFEAQAIIFSRDIPTIQGLVNKTTKSLKKIYENNALANISAICTAAVVNIGTSYNFRPDVLRTVSAIITQYNGYIANLNELQSLNGGSVGAYIPNAPTITMLYNLVNLTTNYLFAISAGAKQQRTLVLPYDTNVILVANQLYGMAVDDSTIQTVIQNNNIGKNEIFTLKQGRQILYYV